MTTRIPMTARTLRLAPMLMLCACGIAAGSDSTWSLRWQAAPSADTRANALMTLQSRGPQALTANGWSLYFNCLAGVAEGEQEQHLIVERMTGTLYRLHPSAGFTPPPANVPLQLSIAHPELPFNASKAPTGPYLVFDTQPGIAEAVTDYEAIPAHRDAEDPVSSAVFDRNAAAPVPAMQVARAVFPRPLHATPGEGGWVLRALPVIRADAGLSAEAEFARSLFSPYVPAAASMSPAPGVIRLQVARIAGLRSAEAYQLDIDAHAGVRIRGNSAAGVMRGLASLWQLLPPRPAVPGDLTLPALKVRDAPRFEYRGLLLDVARNFQPPASVLRLLDLMARYKLNVLHLHLTDDEGWRLEMAGLPELTRVGARRAHGADPLQQLPPAYGSGPSASDAYGSGHYNAEEYADILRHAARLHIEVIPEIEMPGHARAAVVAMQSRAAGLQRAGEANAGEFLLSDPQDRSVYRSAQGYADNVIDPGLESTYTFIAKVVDSLVELHRSAGVPLKRLHVGGDELPVGAWSQSPASLALMRREGLQSKNELWNYFYARVRAILSRHGIRGAGWEELGTQRTQADASAKPAINSAARGAMTVYVWNDLHPSEDLAYRLANAGFDTILAPATVLYFDMAHDAHPQEPGTNWAAYTDTDQVFGFIPFESLRGDGEALSRRGRAHVRGLEAALFSETVRGTQRLDYMLMPRLLAFAERSWAADPDWARERDPREAARLRQADWARFANQVGTQLLPQLDAEPAGVRYRIPPPGAKRVGHQVWVNQQLPGFTLRYTSDGSEPGAESPVAAGVIDAHGDIRIAAFAGNARSSRAVLVRNP